MTCADKFYLILNTYILSTLSYIAESFCILSVILIMLCFLGREGTFSRKTVYPFLAFIGVGTVLNLYSVLHDYAVLKNHWNEPFQENVVKLTDKAEYNMAVTILVIAAVIVSVFMTFSEYKILNCFIAGFMMVFYETYISVEMICTTLYFSQKSRNYVLQGSFIYEDLGDVFSFLFVFSYLLIMLSVFLALYFGMVKKQRTLFVGWKERIVFMTWEFLMVCLAYIPIFFGGNMQQQERYMGYELALTMPFLGIIIPLLMLIVISNRNVYEKTVIQEEYISAELDFINQYKKNQHETRAFRHDIINNLSMLAAIHNDKNDSEAEAYLKDLIGNVKEMSSKYVTGDEMLDCIVGMKSFKMEEEGIDFSLDGYIEGGLGMKPSDVCGIFANAIDNAIEACEMISENKKKWINMSLKRDNEAVFIQIQNSSLADGGKNALGEKVNSKKDSSLHGFGIQNMRNTIAKYNGTESMILNDESFELAVSIPVVKASV